MGTIEHKGTVLITGASSGIGAIYADRLARRGYDLILVARNEPRLRALTSRLTDATGCAIEIIIADLIIPAELARVENTLRTDASIVMLVNNAGVGAVGPLLVSSIGKMCDMIALNVLALTRLTYAVVPAFAARGTGTVVNIASSAAIMPEMLNGVYGASKAFVLALSQSLHHELSGKGIRIQAILPGAISTEFWDTAGRDLASIPPSTVMLADAMVDAALAGLDQGELVTIPLLRDYADWASLEAMRHALAPGLSRKLPAARYRVPIRRAA